MPIYHRYKLIHIHIPKCGGTSIEKFMGISFIWPIPYIEYSWGLYKTHELQHITCTEMLDLNIISRDKFKSYFKFAVIRNPYERMVSAICGAKKISDIKTFRYLLKYSDLSHVHYDPQAPFIYDKDGNLQVDRVIRFENYGKEVIDLLTNITGNKIISKKHNSNYHKTNYMSYYDTESLGIVNKMYARDFELLGYDMIYTPV